MKGCTLTCVMPENATEERRRLLRLYGATIVDSPGSEGSNGAVRLALELAEREPRYFMPFQYANEANPRAHYEGTPWASLIASSLLARVLHRATRRVKGRTWALDLAFADPRRACRRRDRHRRGGNCHSVRCPCAHPVASYAGFLGPRRSE